MDWADEQARTLYRKLYFPTLTDEQWATWLTFGSDSDHFCAVVQLLGNALRAERERCAQIAAAQYAPLSPDGDWSGSGEAEKMALYIERQIRNS